MKHIDFAFGSETRRLRPSPLFWAWCVASLAYGCIDGVDLGERGTGGQAGADGEHSSTGGKVGTGGAPTGGSSSMMGGARDSSAGSPSVGTGGVPGAGGTSSRMGGPRPPFAGSSNTAGTVSTPGGAAGATGSVCGDGVVQGDEQCDDGLNDDSYGGCAHDCSIGPRCGDGVVQLAQGEACDLGDENGAPGSACGDGCVVATP